MKFSVAFSTAATSADARLDLPKKSNDKNESRSMHFHSHIFFFVNCETTNESLLENGMHEILTLFLLQCWFTVDESSNLQNKRLESLLNTHCANFKIFWIPSNFIELNIKISLKLAHHRAEIEPMSGFCSTILMNSWCFLRNFKFTIYEFAMIIFLHTNLKLAFYVGRFTKFSLNPINFSFTFIDTGYFRLLCTLLSMIFTQIMAKN